jgi:TetR/AcrR family transcriptional regulator, transcriptional repressor for nem operon
MHDTKRRLIEAGLTLMLERGYNDLGVQPLLDRTGVPKGSFYHHFRSKEDFALQVVDHYMAAVHAQLDTCLADETHPPLERVRNFFRATRGTYASQGYLGCLLGGLGQELSGVNETFRRRISECLAGIGRRIAACLEEARLAGQLAPASDPEALADVLIDCWEGAALRTRLLRDPAPLDAVLDFYFRAASATV